MTVLSMPVLPDCTRCGGPVVLDVDGDGTAREVCVPCGLALRPVPPKPDRAGIRAAAQQPMDTEWPEPRKPGSGDPA